MNTYRAAMCTGILTASACVTSLVGSAQTWAPVTALNANAASDSGVDLHPQVTTDGAGVWIAVWSSTDSLGSTIGTDRDILYARSVDNGATWSSPLALNTNASSDIGDDELPQLTTNGQGVWIAIWNSSDDLGGTIGTDNDILISRSVNDGMSWSAPAALNSNAASDTGNDRYVQVTTDDAGLWIAVWYTDSPPPPNAATDYDIVMSRSTNDGVTWSTMTALNTNWSTDNSVDSYPQITTDGGVWVAVWYSAAIPGNGFDGDIAYARSNDGGITWTAPAALNTNAAVDDGEDVEPQITVDGAGTWVAVWHSDDSTLTNDNDWDILYSRSTNAGSTWSAPAVVDASANSNVGLDRYPQVMASGPGHFFVVWQTTGDLGGTIGTDGDIVFALSTNGGLAWAAPAPVNPSATSDSGEDSFPQIAMDQTGALVAVWHSNDSLSGSIGTDGDIMVSTSNDPISVPLTRGLWVVMSLLAVIGGAKVWQQMASQRVGHSGRHSIR